MRRDDCEAMRVKHLIRKRILHGRARMPLSRAKRLIGPDCAYHLYRNFTK